MSEEKHIDRLFQEKFKDFEVAPSDAVWDKLSQNLPQKKKKRRVIALWWQVGGVAAVIALLLTVGVSVFNSEGSTDELPVVNSDNTTKTAPSDPVNPSKQEGTETTPSEDETFKFNIADTDPETLKPSSAEELDTPTPSDKEWQPSPSSGLANRTESQKVAKKPSTQKDIISDLSEASSKVAVNSEKDGAITKETSVLEDSEKKSVIKQSISENKSAVAEANTVEKSGSGQNDTEKDKVITDSQEKLTEDNSLMSIEDAIALQTTTKNEKEKADEPNRWSIEPSVAPVYFSSLGQGSPINEQFNDNAKGSDISMSIGIAGTYAINKRLKVRAGVNRINLNQSTADVFAFTGGSDTAGRGVNAVNRMDNVNLNANGQSVILVSTSMMDVNSVPELFNSKISGDIDQRFGFIEVPLELEYRLIDRKFGLNVIGGMSTFFLNENEIYADINGSSTLIGEANNINSTSFSANFGLGMDYNLSKQWNINLEPMFKYQLNTFNNTSGNFRPFFIGVYTGLSFKF